MSYEFQNFHVSHYRHYLNVIPLHGAQLTHDGCRPLPPHLTGNPATTLITCRDKAFIRRAQLRVSVAVLLSASSSRRT